MYFLLVVIINNYVIIVMILFCLVMLFMEKRLSFVDVLRGMAIFFIVLGHSLIYSSHCSLIFKFLYSFHVPLFFLISGYVFKLKDDENFFSFVKRKFKRIMVPYFVWALLFLIPYYIFGAKVNNQLNTNSSFNIMNSLFGIVYGNGINSGLKQNSPLWFLPALFSMEVFYFYIIKFLKNKKYYINFSFLVITALCGLFSYKFINFLLPWGGKTVLELGIFFLLGYLLNKYKIVSKIVSDKSMYFLFLILMFIFGMLFVFNSNVDCMNYNYGNYGLFLLTSISLSFFFLLISKKLNKNKLLEYLGNNTIPILIFHKLIVVLFQSKFGFFTNLMINSNGLIELILAFLVTNIAIIFSLVCGKIIRILNFEILLGEKVKK